MAAWSRNARVNELLLMYFSLILLLLLLLVVQRVVLEKMHFTIFYIVIVHKHYVNLVSRLPPLCKRSIRILLRIFYIISYVSRTFTEHNGRLKRFGTYTYTHACVYVCIKYIGNIRDGGVHGTSFFRFLIVPELRNCCVAGYFFCPIRELKLCKFYKYLNDRNRFSLFA